MSSLRLALVVLLSGLSSGCLPLIGFTPQPYDISLDEAEMARIHQQVYAFINGNGNIVSHHFDDGVPWIEALSDAPFRPNVANNIERRRRLTAPGLKVFLSVTPLNKMRKSKAGYWGDQDDQPLDDWAHKGFDHPDVVAAYLKYCHRMIQTFRPDYFAYAIEANLWPLDKSSEFGRLWFLLAVTYNQLKASYPNLPIFVTVSDPNDQEHLYRLHYTQALLAISDYVAVSTYPFGDPDIANGSKPLPSNWFSKLKSLAPTKPFAVAETGFAAESVIVADRVIVGGATPAVQAEYMNRLLREAAASGAKFVIWFVPIDYHRLWSKVGSPDRAWVAFWMTNGLLNQNFQPRPAYVMWSGFLQYSRFYNR
jgi:hypothetical protein